MCTLQILKSNLRKYPEDPQQMKYKTVATFLGGFLYKLLATHVRTNLYATVLEGYYLYILPSLIIKLYAS